MGERGKTPGAVLQEPGQGGSMARALWKVSSKSCPPQEMEQDASLASTVCALHLRTQLTFSIRLTQSTGGSVDTRLPVAPCKRTEENQSSSQPKAWMSLPESLGFPPRK